MSWLRLKDIAAGVASNAHKVVTVTNADSVTTITSEDLVEEAIQNSPSVKNVFNAQVGDAIQNDGNVKNIFNNQVGDAIENDANVQNIFNNQVGDAIENDVNVQNSLTAVNNQPGTVVTFSNPPTVNGQPLLPLPTSSRAGEHLIYGAAGSTEVSNKKLIVKAASAARTDFLNQAQDQAVLQLNASFQEILDTFYRFSHRGANDHANVGYEGDWSIDANGNLTQPHNWSGSLGFASQQLYDKYEGTILLRSNNADNDLLGFVLCLTQVDENGTTIPDETITVLRTNETAAHTTRSDSSNEAKWSVVYNLQQDDEAVLAKAATGFNQTGNWNGLYPNGDAVKFRRTPDLLEVWLVQNVASPPAFDDASWGNYLSVDLTAANGGVSAATLEKFRQPCSWGLCAASQGACSWADLTLDGGPAQLEATGTTRLNPQPDPGINRYVFDLETNEVYVYTNGQWVLDNTGLSVHGFVSDGQILYDTSDKGVYIKEDNSLMLLTSKRRTVLQLTDDYTLRASDLDKLIVANPGCDTITINDQYGEGWHCTILNKSNASLTLASGGATNEGSRFGDRGLDQDNTDFDIANSQVVTMWGNGHNDGANLHPEIATSNYGT